MHSDVGANSVRRMIERDALRQILRERGIRLAPLSRDLGKDDGYVSELLTGKNKKDLSEDLLWAISQLRNIEPTALGLRDAPQSRQSQHPTLGLEEETEPYVPQPGDIISKPPPHVALIRARNNVLDEHREHIRAGDLCAFDTTIVEFDKVRDGDIVSVQRMDRANMTGHKGTIMRQFIAPNKLATNSSGPNEIVSIDSPSRAFDYVLRGVFLYTISGAILKR